MSSILQKGVQCRSASACMAGWIRKSVWIDLLSNAPAVKPLTTCCTYHNVADNVLTTWGSLGLSLLKCTLAPLACALSNVSGEIDPGSLRWLPGSPAAEKWKHSSSYNLLSLPNECCYVEVVTAGGLYGFLPRSAICVRQIYFLAALICWSSLHDP